MVTMHSRRDPGKDVAADANHFKEVLLCIVFVHLGVVGSYLPHFKAAQKLILKRFYNTM